MTIYKPTSALSVLEDQDQFFEYISKNLKSYNPTFNYTASVLTSVDYDLGGGQTITKTFNYVADVLTSVVLSGNLPPELVQTTKTFNYTAGVLTSVTYS